MTIEDTLRAIIREEIRLAMSPLIEELRAPDTPDGARRRKSGQWPTSDSTVLTVAQAAALTRRNPETLYLALQSGQLKGAQRTKGGAWRMLRSDVEAWAVR